MCRQHCECAEAIFPAFLRSVRVHHAHAVLLVFPSRHTKGKKRDLSHRIPWCGGRGSNSHGLAATSPSCLRVYLFHHVRVLPAPASGGRLSLAGGFLEVLVREWCGRRGCGPLYPLQRTLWPCCLLRPHIGGNAARRWGGFLLTCFSILKSITGSYPLLSPVLPFCPLYSPPLGYCSNS